MLMTALVVIVVAGFVLESILDYLNDANSDAPLASSATIVDAVAF